MIRPIVPECVAMGVGVGHSLFDQPWWLDAVAPGQWDQVVIERGGSIAARLPFAVKRRFGFRILSTPLLTPALGPWIRPSEGKSPAELASQKELMLELIEALPAFDVFRQNFAPEVMNWLPFHWSGFDARTYYTYRIEDLSDRDRLWAGLHESVRRQIRKAARRVEVRSDLGPQALLRACDGTYGRQGLRRPFDDQTVFRLHLECTRRNAGRGFFAEDARGCVHAAVYLVWDARSAYYLLGGADPEYRNSGAVSLLLWEAILFASQVTSAFDFEGSIVPPIERFFRNFGGRLVPYFHVFKFSRKVRALLAIGDLVSAALDRRGRTTAGPAAARGAACW